MKILRKGNEFRKVSESNMEEYKVVKSLINQGWNYCAKKVYKEFTRGEVVKKAVEEVKNTVETVAKAKTTAKERHAGEKKKLTTKK